MGYRSCKKPQINFVYIQHSLIAKIAEGITPVIIALNDK